MAKATVPAARTRIPVIWIAGFESLRHRERRPVFFDRRRDAGKRMAPACAAAGSAAIRRTCTWRLEMRVLRLALFGIGTFASGCLATGEAADSPDTGSDTQGVIATAVDDGFSVS